MSGAINPIIVVRTNLPDYKIELIQQREKLVERINAIDEDLKVLARLQAALEPPTASGTDGE